MILTNNVRIGLDVESMSKLRAVLFAKEEVDKVNFHEVKEIGLVLMIADGGLFIKRRYLDASALLSIDNADCIRLRAAINEFWGMADAFVEDNELIVTGIVNNGYSENNMSGEVNCQFKLNKSDLSLLAYENGLNLYSDEWMYETSKLVIYLSKQQVKCLLELQETIRLKDGYDAFEEPGIPLRSVSVETKLVEDCLIIGRLDIHKGMRLAIPSYVYQYLAARFETGRVELVTVDVDKADDRLEIKVYLNRSYKCQGCLDIYDNTELLSDCDFNLDDEYDFEVKL